jgi:subtilisin family serine protease
MADAKRDTDKPGLHYLWPLVAIGLIDEGEDADTPNDTWLKLVPQDPAEVEQPVTVAIIDNGCAGWRDPCDTSFNPFEHPNLDGHRLVHPIDFTGHVKGAVYNRGADDWSPRDADDRLLQDLRAIAGTHAGIRSQVADHVTAVLDHATTGKGAAPDTAEYPEIPDPSDRFAAHGTSCAGLVAAHAGWIAADDGAKNMAQGSARRRNPNAIGYSGVCPSARIIPVNTVYNTEYWPMICALLWAVVKGADVILIPRGLSDLPDPAPETAGGPSGLRDSRLMTDPARHAEKALFEALLTSVAERVPVVVAAGNQGTGRLNYPASLGVTRGEAGPAAELFIAGAVTARGKRASYSAGFAEPEHSDRVFYCPSDDGEDVNEDIFRYDSLSWRGRNLDMDRIVRGRSKGANDFSPYGVMAIDIPGQYGYVADPGPLNDFGEKFSKTTDPDTAENLPRALYCTFGGTSAAASILAGVIALYIQANRSDGSTAVDTIRKALKKARAPARNLGDGPAPKDGIKIVRADKLLEP